MKLKINNINKMKHIRLIKNSLIIGLMIPTISGCDLKNTSDYYLVHNDDNYYICMKSNKFVNSCDIEYRSIIDNKIVGSICLNKNNFDYQVHHFATDFLSELQIVSMQDLLGYDFISSDELMNIAKKDLKSIGDSYYKNKEYLINEKFEFYFDSNLSLYNLENKIIVGYDMSPKRLSGTGDYVYSVIDKDVIKLSDKSVNTFDISKYFNNDKYITYETALELVNNKSLEKVLRK